MSPEPGLEHMRRAIALAASRLGETGDNPSVGCVIVKRGKVVGEAVTGLGGRPHAEEQALAQAGEAARGATAFVTLEPCGARSSGGASCASLLSAAGVAEVIVACEDASTFASGRGTEALQAAGTPVRSGVLKDEAAFLYEGYKPSV